MGIFFTGGCAFDLSYTGEEITRNKGFTPYQIPKQLSRSHRERGTAALAISTSSDQAEEAQFKVLRENRDQEIRGQDIRMQPPDDSFSIDEVLDKFEDNDDENYLLRRGDVIFIEVWTNPELSGSHIIGPDGKITLPVSGPTRVTGLTREEAAAKVVEILSQNYPNMTATVRVDKYSPYSVSVLGHVVSPGVYLFQDRPTLLKAITQAGGLIEDRLPSGQLAPKPHVRRCAIIRAKQQLALFDINPLLQGKNLDLNFRLRPDDIVQIPQIEATPLYVLGQVETAGFYTLAPNMTILDALAQAGGLTRDASQRNIYLINLDSDMKAKINLKKLMEPDSRLDVDLIAGDIIYVPPNWIAEIGYVMRNLSPLNAFFILAN